MSRFFFCFLLLVSFPALADEEFEWYLFGGLSTFKEDFNRYIGGDLGSRFGAGLQFNKLFGIECFVDRAPALDKDAIIDEVVYQHIGDNPYSYDLNYRGNLYFSILGTASVPVSQNSSWILKAGIARYDVEWKKAEFNWTWTYTTLWGTTTTYHETRDFAIKDTGSDAILSTGFVINTKGNSSVEVSITQKFGDWEALSFDVIGRYKF